MWPLYFIIYNNENQTNLLILIELTQMPRLQNYSDEMPVNNAIDDCLP